MLDHHHEPAVGVTGVNLVSRLAELFGAGVAHAAVVIDRWAGICDVAGHGYMIPDSNPCAAGRSPPHRAEVRSDYSLNYSSPSIADRQSRFRQWRTCTPCVK